MLHTLSSTSFKSLRTTGLLKSTLASQRQVAKQERVAEKLRTGGLKGSRLGKHRVPEGEVDVQLGEDLSESLRGLKVNSWLLIPMVGIYTDEWVFLVA